MQIFLDTEFTDLVEHPLLLSLALCGPGGGQPEFYAEVTDRSHLSAASWYALSAVLPQFGLVAGAGGSYRALGLRLGLWLARRTAALPPGQRLGVAFGCHKDWELLQQAVADAGCPQGAQTLARLQPVNIHAQVRHGAGRVASEGYFRAQAEAPYGRHHALCDARALSLAWQASRQDARCLAEATAAHPAQAGGLSRQPGALALPPCPLPASRPASVSAGSSRSYSFLTTA